MADLRRLERRREALQAEHDFLLTSVEDLEREHRAGDLGEDDYETLRADYLARAERARRDLEAVGEAAERGEPAAPVGGMRRFRRYLGRRGVRRVLVSVALVCAAGLLVTVALLLAGVRLPGQTATGSVNLPANETTSQQLAAASVLGQEGQFSQAINLYDAILARTPGEAEARTNRAWLIRLVGIAGSAKSEVTSGDAELAAAAEANPHYAPAQAFYGLARLEDDHDTKGALVAFRAFLADKPSADLRQSLAPAIKNAYATEHLAIPAPLRQQLITPSPGH